MAEAAQTRSHPFRSALELIGHTPMLELAQFDAGHCRLFAKLENQNPGGSIKDRIGLSMIEAAERDGHIRPGADPPSTLIEATAGNTGLGLALVASQKGYRLILVIPDKMAQEKILHLRAVNRGTPRAYLFPKPSFEIVVLYVGEKESVERQLKRGQETILHNQRVHDAVDLRQQRRQTLDDRRSHRDGHRA